MLGKNVRLRCGYFVVLGAFVAACGSSASGDRAPSAAPLVSEEDRKLLEEMKRKEQARQDLEVRPWDFVTSGDGNVQTFDKGIINDYTEIKQYPVHNTTEFDIRSIDGEVTIYKADDTVLAT